MAAPDTYRLGYEHVDDDPNVDVLLATMDATSQWDATKTLREWERSQLKLAAGERLLDVGCGLGTASLALAGALGPNGAIVGVDASDAMVDVARRRATAAVCSVRFVTGDAGVLELADGSFDAARSERTLQWVSDPGRAVTELARVIRPRGRVALIDTDWSTLRLEVGDEDLSARVVAALQFERRRPSNVGARLGQLAEGAGLVVTASTTATQVWSSWNPDESPTPLGCFSMQSLVENLVETGQADQSDAAGLVAAMHDAASDDRFNMSLTMFAILATKPSAC